MSSGDDVVLHNLQRRWMQAWVGQDFETLESILAPDFSLVISARPDHRVDRSQWLETARTSYHAQSFQYDSMLVRLFGDIAVVASVATQVASVNGVDRSGRFFLTDVWRRAGDTWQVIERHSSHPEAHSQSAAAVSFRER
jgi:ketosteroid isomerase-like protein